MSIKYGGGPKFKYQKGEGYTRTDKMIGRKVERIPGGPGDVKKYVEPDNMPDPNTLTTIEDRLSGDDDTVTPLHENPDVQASLEMALEDMQNGHMSVNETSDEEKGYADLSLHTRQVKEAEDPNSSAYWNGRRPYAATEIANPRSNGYDSSVGEDIQNGVERKLYSRGRESIRMSFQEEEDKWYMRWINRLRRGKNQRKKGQTNP